jgi:hypothetical protein
MHGEQMDVIAELTPTPLHYMGTMVGATHRFWRFWLQLSVRRMEAWEGIDHRKAILIFATSLQGARSTRIADEQPLESAVGIATQETCMRSRMICPSNAE